MSSPEYQARNPPLRMPVLDGDEPAMCIEELQAGHEVQRLLAHVQTAWQHLGETEPYWSVVTGAEYLMANIEQSRDQFYETGKPDVVRLRRTFERNGIEMAKLRTCLEYGCGLGRVTRWLAPHFDQLYAYDISLPHLESIQQYLRQRQVNNVVVKQVQSVDDLATLPQVDFIYSLVVLQHNPPPVIALLIERLLEALNPGGYAYFQTPTYRINYHFCLNDYLQNEGQRQEMEMHVLPQSTIFQIVQRSGAQLVEVLEDGHTGFRPKERSNSFFVRKLPKP
jgi:SAM-dependent methyltransferase